MSLSSSPNWELAEETKVVVFANWKPSISNWFAVIVPEALILLAVIFKVSPEDIWILWSWATPDDVENIKSVPIVVEPVIVIDGSKEITGVPVSTVTNLYIIWFSVVSIASVMAAVNFIPNKLASPSTDCVNSATTLVSSVPSLYFILISLGDSRVWLFWILALLPVILNALSITAILSAKKSSSVVEKPSISILVPSNIPVKPPPSWPTFLSSIFTNSPEEDKPKKNGGLTVVGITLPVIPPEDDIIIVEPVRYNLVSLSPKITPLSGLPVTNCLSPFKW